jgi:hypothetical protein
MIVAVFAAPTFIQKLWNNCNVLRDDGMSYSDYIEHLSEEQFDHDRHSSLTTTCQMFSKRLHLLPN